MSKKKRWRFLKTIVTYCIAFSSAVVVAGLIICGKVGCDPSSVVSSALLFFGGELLMSCLTKITEPKEKNKNDE